MNVLTILRFEFEVAVVVDIIELDLCVRRIDVRPLVLCLEITALID